MPARRTTARHDARRAKKKRRLSLLGQLEITEGRKADYETFARWHYRSHNLGIARFVTLLWHRITPSPPGSAGGEGRGEGGESHNAPTSSLESESPLVRKTAAEGNPSAEPIGICVFTSAPLALSQRNRFFGINPRRSRTQIRVLDRQIVHLSRVVLHPSWRGAGVASRFVRRSCEACPWPWIETLAEMGRLNPFFEHAGFVRVGTTRPRRTNRQGHSSIYGTPRRGRKPIVTPETFAKSRFAAPIYYVFDNRDACSRRAEPEPATDG